ncbi:hypothetical protein [Pseudomonas arsenicoxydans]|uniref:hypothetical protein n=1 Tax=Pseudomonas arsenicoxydans TaxID=702115 RepID=UPI001ABF711B|nr:hypothetical protein [Pseudomonas arsenicoxydans]
MQRLMHTICTEPFEEEFIISAILRNNELNGHATNGARYKEITHSELYMIEYNVPKAFGGMFEKDSIYKHTLHPIGVLFDKARYKSMVFVPRGNFRICVQCVMNDVQRTGTSFIHRQHVMPGTLTCHLHASPLLATCPVCRVKIKHHRINTLSECISQLNNIADESSPNSETHKYAKFVNDILQRADAEKYRLHAIATIDRSLKKMGYSSSSKTGYLEVSRDTDNILGLEEGGYQKACKSKQGNQTSMHLFPRIAYLIYETLDTYISEIEEYSSNIK